MIKSIHNVEERFKLYAQKCAKLLQLGQCNPKKVQRDISCTENYIMQVFREREQFIIGKEDKRHNSHRDTLRKCYHHIISDLELVNSSVLDRLLEDDVMSVSDKDSIIMKGTKKSQNEEFYRYIYGKVTREDFHNSLLPSLKKDHGHLAEILSKELVTLDESTDDVQCGTCEALKIVQVKRLATSLFKAGVIDNAVHADLRSDSITNSQKWKELLEHANVSHVHIIDAMEKEYPDLYHDFRRRNITTLKCFCGAPDTLSVVSDFVSPYRRDVIANSTTGAGDVAALDDLQSFLSLPIQDTESAYPMNARPRGICVIINNRDFQESQDDAGGRYRGQHGLGKREGTDVDAKRLEYIFSKLEFTIRPFTNLTDTQMVEELQCVASTIDHKPFDAFVCCILSHGVKDRVYGTNCRDVKVSDLTAPFRASACPSLAGKPKMFFIQAAQGNIRMQGLNVEDGVELPVPCERTPVDASVVRDDPPQEKPDKQKWRSKGSPDERNIIPDESDFLLGYATSPGYVSYRSKRHGSWYIIRLAEVLEKYGDRLDLLSCLMMVNDEVAKGNAMTKDGVFKQVPAPMFTLRKKVNLTSDPMWFRSLSTINE
uniref:Caspase-8 n=1 Tax=Haliotis diversicolor TaxID=36095 RepID=A0A3G1VB64_HALDV|nr:caspase-8 [Haliotis diversicolor]